MTTLTAPATRTTTLAGWDLDAAHSSAEFSVKHLMIATVRGRMSITKLDLSYDPERPEDTRIVAELDAASIGTGSADRDAHLRSPDFLDVASHPTLRFESTRVERVGDEGFRVRGDLTIRGVTKPVTLEVEHEGEAIDPWGKRHAALTARATIDRTEWGLTWNAALETGGVLVGEKVKVELHVQLIGRA